VAVSPALAALIVDPDDQAQRLVYADWLEQQGETSHAEMVRLGVELAALGGFTRPHFGVARGLRRQSPEEAARAEAICDRMRALVDDRPRWESRLPVVDGLRWDGAFYFGGVFEGVNADSWKVFAGAADALAELTPLRSLGLKRLDVRGARALVDSGWLARLRHLSLHGATVSANALEVVLGSPDARGLRSIDLSMTRLRDSGAARVAASPNLAGLEALFLYMNGIGDRGAIALADSPHLQGLRALNLELNHLSWGAARAFGLPDVFPDMVFLNLFDNEPLEHGGVEQSLRARWGDRLEI
jgi:uncharacterized protein (TIGR02996 family)